jgi:hypothetical protein
MKSLINKTFISFSLVLIGIFFSQTGNGQTANEIAVKIKAEKLSGDKFTVETKTKKGAKIFAVKKPNKNLLKAIDKGLSELFTVAGKNGYKSHLNFSDYIIFIAKADRQTDSDGNYIPNFAIPVAQYAGTDYDKGGYMYAAGMVISNNPSAFMIAENEKKLEQVTEVVRFEGEHLVLYHNDSKRYNETADHSQGGGHPILR